MCPNYNSPTLAGCYTRRIHLKNCEGKGTGGKEKGAVQGLGCQYADWSCCRMGFTESRHSDWDRLVCG